MISYHEIYIELIINISSQSDVDTSVLDYHQFDLQCRSHQVNEHALWPVKNS